MPCLVLSCLVLSCLVLAGLAVRPSVFPWTTHPALQITPASARQLDLLVHRHSLAHSPRRALHGGCPTTASEARGGALILTGKMIHYTGCYISASMSAIEAANCKRARRLVVHIPVDGHLLVPHVRVFGSVDDGFFFSFSFSFFFFYPPQVICRCAYYGLSI